MKLSDAQVEILRGLAKGYKLKRGMYTRGGLMPPRFTVGAQESFSAASLVGLVRRGLVVARSRPLGVFEIVYDITDAGRAAIASMSDG